MRPMSTGRFTPANAVCIERPTSSQDKVEVACEEIARSGWHQRQCCVTFVHNFRDGPYGSVASGDDDHARSGIQSLPRGALPWVIFGGRKEPYCVPAGGFFLHRDCGLDRLEVDLDWVVDHGPQSEDVFSRFATVICPSLFFLDIANDVALRMIRSAGDRRRQEVTTSPFLIRPGAAKLHAHCFQSALTPPQRTPGIIAIPGVSLAAI